MALSKDFPMALWLSLKDYFHEWRMSFCFVLSLAAILAPMLVLFGLKFGIISSMAERLIQDPRNREVRPVGSGHFESEWFESLRSRRDVAFVSPRTRSISATINLQNPSASRSQIVSVELIPTGTSDPLLEGDNEIPGKLSEIVLSDSAARKLGVLDGDTVDGSLARVYGGKRERVHLSLQVIGVAKPSAFIRDGAFVPLKLLVALEDFRDGRAVPELGWQGESRSSDARTFAGYRLYARSIYDVAVLRNTLMAQGLDVRTKTTDIEIVRSLDRNLSILYWVIALVALIGFSLSLGASLWANVDRKRRELSIMRLVGFRTSGIIWFPILQALLTGVFGWLLASLIYLSVEQGLNQLFMVSLSIGESICRLLPIHFLGALLFTLLSCVLASGLGGWQASRIEPSEGVREI